MSLSESLNESQSTESLRDKISAAIRHEDKDQLLKVIAECETANYPELSPDLRKARDTLDRLGGGRGG